MRNFNYSAIKDQKWDSDILGLIAAIYKSVFLLEVRRIGIIYNILIVHPITLYAKK